LVESLHSRLLTEVGFPLHGFTTRVGGVSAGPFESLNLAHDVGDDPGAVAENLERLRRRLGVEAPLLRVKQVHGIGVIDGAELLAAGGGGWSEPPLVEGDAIAATGIQAVLAVQVADCAAVLLADPETRAVSAIHAGWRGAARGVVRNAVRDLIGRGAAPLSLRAAIGPCICSRCYEVGEEVAHRFPESAEPIAGLPGKYLLDLGYAIEVSLITAGLTSAHIERIETCSSCDERLFSRRGSGGESCGRTLGFVSAAPGGAPL
jgi:YfiH family protein